MTAKEQGKEYTCCRGLLFYGGLQKTLGQEPRCFGYKLILPNVQVTEEGGVPPPPEKAKFIFISIGVSVYNREMLLGNQLPLVNGISQLIISEEVSSQGNLPRRDVRERQPHDQPHEYPQGVMASDNLASGAFPGGRQRRHSVADGNGNDNGVRDRVSVPRRRQHSPEEVEEMRTKEREEATKEAQQKIEELLATAGTRVRRHCKISVDLALATPGKMPQAASAQASKAKEMPVMMMNTAKKGLDLGALAVRSISDQLSDDTDKKK